MTLTWCSVHALKNKVLLKIPTGPLVLKNKTHIYYIYQMLNSNHCAISLTLVHRMIIQVPYLDYFCFQYCPMTKRHKPQISSCHGSQLLFSTELGDRFTAQSRRSFNYKRKLRSFVCVHTFHTFFTSRHESWIRIE